MKKALKALAAIIAAALVIACSSAAKQPIAAQKATEGRFTAYEDGTVLDTHTDLMWAAKDNGYDISWVHAKFYCENYRGGGHKDWRMPTLKELESLYDPAKSRAAPCHGGNSIHVATELIDISCFIFWTSQTSDAEVAIFDFGPGIRSGFSSQVTLYCRALPVRYNR